MEQGNELKTDPLLVFLIIAIVVVGSFVIFKEISKNQSEDKIKLYGQGEDNLAQPLVDADKNRTSVPPVNIDGEDDLANLSSLTETPNSNLTPPSPNTPQESKIPSMIIDINKKYSASLDTSEGKIVIELDAVNTPITANNFVYLSQNGFYNNTIFHRVIKGFMIQGGDPEGTGAGGPGYKFNDEPITGEYTRGTVAMANAGPNTNGSQFFIMHEDNPLPKSYVIFGKVVEGMETVDKIAEAEVTMSPSGEPSKPINPVKILTVQISELQ